MGERLDVLLQFREHDCRNRNRPRARLSLRRPEVERLTRHLHQRPLNSHGASLEIDVLSSQRHGLTPTQVREGREQDERPVTMVDRLGQCEHFGDAQDGPLWRVLGPATLDRAGVPLDHAVTHRRVHDGLEQPIRLGHRDASAPSAKRRRSRGPRRRTRASPEQRPCTPHHLSPSCDTWPKKIANADRANCVTQRKRRSRVFSDA